jgi:hypothetical protein
MEDRYVLGIGSADSADCTQFADAISRVQGGDPVNATVPVGCVSGIQLVGASYPLNFRVTPDRVLYWESKISRNAEYFGYSDVLKSRQDVLDYGRR